MMNLNAIAAICTLAIATSMGACLTEDEPSVSVHQSAIVGVSGDQCTTLWAGQHMDAGTICVSTDETNLYIHYAVTGDWELTEAQAWIGEDLADMPQTPNGAPKIGNFPYNAGDITGATSHTFTVALESLGGEPYVCDRQFFVAAHASVRRPTDVAGEYQTETGWAGGDRLVDQGTWAMAFPFTLTCEEPPPVDAAELSCETAFAYGGELATTFTSLMDTPRWGWSNGPLGAGSYTFDIYAGAGQNDLSKGAVVGTLNIEYDGASATVTYTMADGYTMDETHLYIGSQPLPSGNDGDDTVAPGQFGNIHDLTDATSDTFVVDGLSGDIYVVAHAVSCFAAAP